MKPGTKKLWDDDAQHMMDVLKCVENIPLDQLETVCAAIRDGKCVVLPFVAMIEQSLQDGKMRPQADQKHNGRYAVVYADKTKWGTPLIDICGTHYNAEQAENRRDALAAQEGDME